MRQSQNEQGERHRKASANEPITHDDDGHHDFQTCSIGAIICYRGLGLLHALAHRHLAPCRDFQNETHIGTARMTATSDWQDQTMTDCGIHTE